MALYGPVTNYSSNNEYTDQICTSECALQVLSNSLFAGLSKAQRIQSEREHSAKQIWSTDFRSQMSNALDSLDSVDIIKIA